MFRIVAALLVLFAGVVVRAQEQPATVVMDDGRVLEGTVVAIELGSMQLRVGTEVLTLSTAQITSCKMPAGATPAPQDPPKTGGETGAVPPAEPAAVPAVAAEAPPAAPAAEPAPVAPAPVGSSADAPAAGGGDGAPAARPAASKDPSTASTRRPTARALAPVREGPPMSLLQQRLHMVDVAFPWLLPTVPTQWVSVGLLLFALLSLIVHMSVGVAGAESATFSRSMAIALWYMLTGFLQVAMVPSVHVATFSMLIGNTAMALFWLRNLFGVSRGGAMVAFAVQLGFAVVVYGVLELVTSLLASIETMPA